MKRMSCSIFVGVPDRLSSTIRTFASDLDGAEPYQRLEKADAASVSKRIDTDIQPNHDQRARASILIHYSDRGVQYQERLGRSAPLKL
jgi:hypothetical protein